ncbi:MAG: 16S rRNA (guanine(527)-N(7))-methyltransferase RsmG [Deltaproteobacteria bacterium]|nr:16S rRNA (guanine(527)-N(7))-methyltransferase RsmG [Deltaproteobacteria bacterium]
MGVPLGEKQLDLFCRYYREIMSWNEKINLLSRSSSEDTLLKNFIDSLTAVQFLRERENRILDMGSGGGFPGIPLKIACSTLQVSLLEASRKKTSFLKHIIRTLQLEKITVIHERAENLPDQESCRNSFDIVISKAAFKLPQFITLGASFLRPGGILMAMKGADISDELAAAQPAAAAAGE